ncbi:MAG: hypothetical protein M3R31_03465 [Pseudomonadota bacterium]|nr:hypothetical protein [Pseudomonadota bacterium]
MPAVASKVALGGNVKAVVSGGTVVLFAGRIQNSSAHSTGTLRLELWAASQPFGGGDLGEFKLAQFQLGVLPVGGQYVNVSSPSLQLGTPPDGTWYYVMFLTEFTGATANGGFSIVDWRNLPATITVGTPAPSPPLPPPTAAAVEYYNADWGFYFLTSFPEEISALDNGAFNGAWQRTGESFSVWPLPIVGSVATCRFFSAVFAPRSTHVYTPFVSECSALKTNPAWSYEGIAFYVQLANASGICAPGTIALYRLYNNGMGGAPNHRYTTSISTLVEMIAAGWVFEGNGNTKVFACVPQ